MSLEAADIVKTDVLYHKQIEPETLCMLYNFKKPRAQNKGKFQMSTVCSVALINANRKRGKE